MLSRPKQSEPLVANKTLSAKTAILPGLSTLEKEELTERLKIYMSMGILDQGQYNAIAKLEEFKIKVDESKTPSFVDLSAKAYNYLRNHDLLDLDKLCLIKKEELPRSSGVRTKTFDEIESFLGKYKRTFGMKRNPDTQNWEKSAD